MDFMSAYVTYEIHSLNRRGYTPFPAVEVRAVEEPTVEQAFKIARQYSKQVAAVAVARKNPYAPRKSAIGKPVNYFTADNKPARAIKVMR